MTLKAVKSLDSVKPLKAVKSLRSVKPLARPIMYFSLPNPQHDILDWVYSISPTKSKYSQSLDEALVTTRIQIRKANALPEATPAEARRKSQSFRACYDMLALILAHME